MEFNDERLKMAVDTIVEQISGIILEMLTRSLTKINEDLCKSNASLRECLDQNEPEF